MLKTLTPEQQATLPLYHEKWLRIGLDTTPIDKRKAKQAIHLLYECGGLKPPKEILFYPSPFALVREQQVEISNFLYGQHEAAWLAFYDFFINETNIDTTKAQQSLRGLIAVAETCGWVQPYDVVCYVSEKPCDVHFNATKQLHRDDGPAILYRDGSALYSLNGVSMEPWQVTTAPSDFSGAQVLGIENAEQRREVIRRIGIERFMTFLQPITLETKGEYELLQVRLSEEVPKAVFLKMKNPSIGVYHVEGVDPTCRTVEEAVNWRAGHMKTPWKPSILT